MDLRHWNSRFSFHLRNFVARNIEVFDIIFDINHFEIFFFFAKKFFGRNFILGFGVVVKTYVKGAKCGGSK